MTSEKKPESKYFTVLLLTDKVHLERAKQVIREGEPTLAMDFGSEDGDKATFTANDILHHVKYWPDPMGREHLGPIIQGNVFWNLTGQSYPEHSAIISIGRIRSENTLLDFLAMTEIIHAITRKITTHAIVWLPDAAISMSMFDSYYETLYETGVFPIFAWLGFYSTTKGPDISVFTSGLAGFRLTEVEFMTLPENIAIDTMVAGNVIQRMLDGNFVFPDGSVAAIDFNEMQGSVRFSHRPSIRKDGSTVCFLEIERQPGGRPLPGVH